METVVGCKQVKEWTAKDGKKVPIYAVELSDGQGGESFGKEIPVGTPLSELVLESGRYGLKIKWNKPGASGGFSGGGKSRSGNESFAMSYAKDIVVGGKTDLKNLLPLADKIYAWLEAKKAPPVVLASQLPSKPSSNYDNDELPF
jgi:hypothetical protein